MLRVEHSSRSALNFAMTLLDPRHDKLALVRCKGHSQLGLGQMEEQNSDKRILESFQVRPPLRHHQPGNQLAATALNHLHPPETSQHKYVVQQPASAALIYPAQEHPALLHSNNIQHFVQHTILWRIQ